MLLPDINVWIALTVDGHPHHRSAQAWYDTSQDTCCFCRLTQQGFLRLASNRAALRDHAVNLQKAWQLYDAILSDPRVVFAEEPEGIEDQWRAFTQRRSFSPKVWSDAYLAAFARTGSLELVTFDKAFSQFPKLNSTLLS